MKPKIHILYPEMVNLIQKLMSRFVKSKLLYNNETDGSRSYKSTENLLLIQSTQANNCKPLRMIDIGTKAKSRLLESIEMSGAEKKFRQNCLEFYQKATEHLKTKLPLHSSVLKKAVFLDAREKNDTGALSAISNLALEVCKPLKSSLNKLFLNCHTIETVCDGIRNEFRDLQMDVIPDTYLYAGK